MVVACPYCGQPAKLVTGWAVYPHRKDLASRRYWRCEPCKAWTGADVRRNFAPSGRLANAELRLVQTAAHAAFDPLWKSGSMTQSGAYRWLATELGLPKTLVRIAQFDESMCRRVISAVANREPRAAE